ncbi:MAG: hypothetical protein Q9228_001982, partial [Teloschistes exilis]
MFLTLRSRPSPNPLILQNLPRPPSNNFRPPLLLKPPHRRHQYLLDFVSYLSIVLKNSKEFISPD